MPESEQAGKVIRMEAAFQRTSAVSTKDLIFETPGKTGSRPLLNGISCEIARTGISVIMGANGAGKSLLLRLIAGLILPTEGELLWFGGKRFARGDIAIVFQKPVLLRRTVRANIDHALHTFDVPRQLRRQKCNELLKLGRLADIAERPARVLSGGEQQRLSLVRAMVANPKLLLLDEPTASLDPHSTAMIEELTRGAAARNIKVVLVTHDRGQAQRLADDIIFLHSGRITEHTPAEGFFIKPRTAEAKAYLDGKLLVD